MSRYGMFNRHPYRTTQKGNIRSERPPGVPGAPIYKTIKNTLRRNQNGDEINIMKTYTLSVINEEFLIETYIRTKKLEVVTDLLKYIEEDYSIISLYEYDGNYQIFVEGNNYETV